MNITFFEDTWSFGVRMEMGPEQPDSASIVLVWATSGRDERRYRQTVDMLLTRERPQMIELAVNSIMLEALHDIARHYDLSSQELMQEQPESTNRLRDFLTSAIRPREPIAPPTRDINDILQENAATLREAHGITRRPLDRNPFNFAEADRRMREAADIHPAAQLTTAQLDEAYRRLQELASRPDGMQTATTPRRVETEETPF